MLTNALSKIPVKYHKGLREGLLFAAFMLMLFGFLFFIGFMETDVHAGVELELSDRIIRLIAAIILLTTAFICLLSAWKLTQMSGRYKKYLAIIKGNEKISIRRIADITDSYQIDVMNDLENMISSEYINGYYIDHRQSLLIDKNFVPKRTVKKAVACETCGTHNEVLVGETNYCKCVSCGNLIILEPEHTYSAPRDYSTKPPVNVPVPPTPPSTPPQYEPDRRRDWLDWAWLAGYAAITFLFHRKED